MVDISPVKINEIEAEEVEQGKGGLGKADPQSVNGMEDKGEQQLDSTRKMLPPKLQTKNQDASIIEMSNNMDSGDLPWNRTFSNFQDS